MVKVTFTLDDGTVSALKQTAARLARPQSQIVREAVAEYAARAGRLSERERMAWMRAFDEVMPASAERSSRDVEAELRSIRSARRSGGRLSSRRTR